MPITDDTNEEKLHQLRTLARNTFPKFKDLPNNNFILMKGIYGAVAKDSLLKVFNKEGKPSWVKFAFLEQKIRKDVIEDGINDLTTNYLLNNMFKRNKSVDYDMHYNNEQNILISTSSLVESKKSPLNYINRNTDGSYIVPQYQQQETGGTQLNDIPSEYIHLDFDSLFRNYILYDYVSNISDNSPMNHTGYTQNGRYKTYQFDGRHRIFKEKDLQKWTIPKVGVLSRTKSFLQHKEYVDKNNKILDEFLEHPVFNSLGSNNLQEYMESHGIDKNSNLILGLGGNNDKQSRKNKKMIMLTALQKLVSLRGEYLESIKAFRENPNFNETREYLSKLTNLHMQSGLSFPIHDIGLALDKIEQRFIVFTNLIEYYTNNWNKTNEARNRIPTYEQQTQAKQRFRDSKRNTTVNRTLDIVVKDGESEGAIALNIFKSMQTIPE